MTNKIPDFTKSELRLIATALLTVQSDHKMINEELVNG
jgi:hypothetical protein